LSTTLLVDGHVHYHPCFGVAPFLQAARSNFATARRASGEPDAIGCLMFTESSWSHYFRAFADGLVEREAPGWAVEATDEECALLVATDGEPGMVLIAGRQIVTAERLEVLALATSREYEEGLEFREAIGVAVSSGAIPVVPWGFGKWTGRRGRAVRALLDSPDADAVYLGDNGGRPGLTPEPSLFQLARDRDVPILPGSDPLPIPAERHKPGRFGFVLQGIVDLRTPAASIRHMISTRSQPRRFGRLEAIPTFVLRQTQLRLKSRRPGPRPVAVAKEASRP
jgi:hypothetical protein